MRKCALNPQRTGLAALVSLLLSGAGALNAGPVSTLYAIAAGGKQTGYVIQGSTATSFALANDQAAVAVLSTVRTLGAPYTGGTGSEYSLAGVNSGNTFANPGSGSYGFYDGTTDGTYNYGANYFNNLVYRMGLDWSNPTPIFAADTGSGQHAGIAYDALTNSLWMVHLGSGTITNYSMTGTTLSSFVPAHQLIALAFDAADGTLWGNADGNTFYQYSTAGTLLGSASYASIPVNQGGGDSSIRGLEFGLVATPEPGTVATSLTGMLLLGAWVRRRKS